MSSFSDQVRLMVKAGLKHAISNDGLTGLCDDIDAKDERIAALEAQLAARDKRIVRLKKALKKSEAMLVQIYFSQPAVVKKIEQGFRDIEAGNFISLDQLEAEIAALSQQADEKGGGC